MPEKDKMVAEYSMGQYDYKRLDELLTQADALSIKVQTYQTDAIFEHFSVLNQIYLTLRTIPYNEKIIEMQDERFTEMKKRIDEMRKAINRGEIYTPTEAFITQLIRLHRHVIEMKQILGLGIQLSSENRKDPKARLRKSLLGRYGEKEDDTED